MTTIYVPEGITKREFNKIAKRVDRGAKLLDEKRPGWWRRIKQSELEMADSGSCILGQAWTRRNGLSAYGQGLQDLFGDAEDPGDEDQRHGFDVSSWSHFSGEYDVLANCWIAEIRERRRASRAK